MGDAISGYAKGEGSSIWVQHQGSHRRCHSLACRAPARFFSTKQVRVFEVVMIPVPSLGNWRPEGFLTARQSRRTVLAQEHQVSS